MHPGVAKSCEPRSTDLMRTALQPQVREDTSSLWYTTNEPTKFVPAFHDGLKAISGSTETQKSTLKFFVFFQIDPDSAFPKIDHNFNGFSQSQIRKVLSTISNTSAVGLSSENKALYALFFPHILRFFSAAHKNPRLE